MIGGKIMEFELGNMDFMDSLNHRGTVHRVAQITDWDNWGNAENNSRNLREPLCPGGAMVIRIDQETDLT